MCKRRAFNALARNIDLIEVNRTKIVTRKLKITLAEVVKNDMLIKKVTKYNFGYDIMTEMNKCG